MKKIHIARLIESELEQYEVILAAKSILDKLQKIAEDLSKIEGNEILPLIDNMNSLFGSEKTNAFSTETTTALRELVTNTTTAREKIGSAIDVLEGKAPATDMEANDLSAPEINNDMAGEEMPEQPEGSEESLDDILGGEPEPEIGGKQENPLGRVRKESVEKNSKLLRESSNPDRLIMSVYSKLKESNHTKVSAINYISEAFGIDKSDVKSIIEENTVSTVVLPKKKVLESDRTKLRLVKSFENDGKSAKVYKDLDWDEYRVKFFKDGKHQTNADYHDSDKVSAFDSARHFCNINESLLREDKAIKVRFVGNENGLTFEYFNEKWTPLDTYTIPENKWKTFCEQWVNKKVEKGVNVDVVGYYFDKAPPISEGK